jgi:RNA polymerase sigma-70 factor (ECF subfamily)
VPPYNEQAILAKVAEGDEQAFRQLYEYYDSKVYGAALAITQEQTSAEEVVQDAFLTIWLRREQLSEISDFTAYFFTVVRNAALKAFKRNARQKNQLEIDSIREPLDDQTRQMINVNDYNSALQKAIDRLPSQQRQVYRLIKEEGCTREEAAQAMKIQPDTVKFHLKVATKTIRAFMVSEFGHLVWLMVMLKNIF